ncbi:hypothetical protein QBC38DRAFT_459108 [Podospora fimiseda]|uniref:Mid2 domain-containing protein n=1 Tax=Podospora fimiseda TaxID=252190 RepID=A0AAN7GP66_9PEZI|nr:hypothetical protein QBC38DRAFT_459108 [Podospora fimiseda]
MKKSPLFALVAANLVLGDPFQGYRILTNGLAQPESCPTSSEFFTTSTFAGCCQGNRGCNIATACNNGRYTFLFDSATGSCGTGNPVCLTRTVFAYPSASDSYTVILCTKSGRPTTESLFIETTSPGGSSTTPPPSPTSGVPTLPLSTTSSSTPPFPTSPPPSSPTDAAEQIQEPPDSSSSSSKAWIAGAVIGPIVGIAIIGFLGYWLGIRRARQRDTNHNIPLSSPPPSQDHWHSPPPPSQAQTVYYYDPKLAGVAPTPVSEMTGSTVLPAGAANLDSNPIHELSPSSNAHELPAAEMGQGYQDWRRG